VAEEDGRELRKRIEYEKILENPSEGEKGGLALTFGVRKDQGTDRGGGE